MQDDKSDSGTFYNWQGKKYRLLKPGEKPKGRKVWVTDRGRAVRVTSPIPPKKS